MTGKWFAALLLLALPLHDAAAQQYAGLARQVHAMSRSKLLKNAQWSVSARYVDTGRPVIAFNEDKCLAPASCLKLVTTAAALDGLGGDFRFVTRVVADTVIRPDGVLPGNVVIVGGGDPTLGSTLVPGSLGLDSLIDGWIQALRAKGIRKIEGGILSDDFAFDRVPIPDDWFWIDMGNYYAPSTSALCLHDNLYELTFRPATVVGAKAEILRMQPEIPGLTFENHMRTGRQGSGDNGYIYAGPGQMNAVVRGTVPAGYDEFSIKGSMPDPPLFAAQYFRQRLIATGIQVAGNAGKCTAPARVEAARILATTLSPALRDIVTIINRRSFNLYAEQVLKMLAVKQGLEGSTANGITAVEQFLSRNEVDTEGLDLHDGCGLSRTNAISSKTMTDMLVAIAKSPLFSEFYGSLSVAGDPDDIGFFKNFGVGTEIAMNARIKSGSIQGVRSHAGYVKDKDGRLIAFSMIANNYASRAGRVDNVHRDIIIDLARLSSQSE